MPPKADPMPPPARKAGGPFKNLSPKQKKVLAVVGIGGLLALVYLMSRRGSAPPEEAEGGAAREGEAFAVPAGGGGGTDPTAFLGAQSEAIGSKLEEVGGALQEVGTGLGEVLEGQDELAQGHEGLEETFMTGNEELTDALATGLATQNRTLDTIKKTITKKPKKPQAKRPAAKPHAVKGRGGGVARVGGAGGASGGKVHPRAYSSGVSAKRPKPKAPRGYHTYKGANGQWWFAPNN